MYFFFWKKKIIIFKKLLKKIIKKKLAVCLEFFLFVFSIINNKKIIKWKLYSWPLFCQFFFSLGFRNKFPRVKIYIRKKLNKKIYKWIILKEKKPRVKIQCFKTSWSNFDSAEREVHFFHHVFMFLMRCHLFLEINTGPFFFLFFFSNNLIPNITLNTINHNS